MYSYFKKYPTDEEFFNKYISSRLPHKITDAHGHFNLPAHVTDITPDIIAGDWALESGLLMSYEDAKYYTNTLFPGIDYSYICLPWPLKDADTIANNDYVAGLIKRDNVLGGLFTLRPEWSTEYIEQRYIEGGFVGFKPYPYMASTVKGADVSIFDFMTKEQFSLANKLGATVLMHLPRAGRLPDPDNISEIRCILDNYPDLTLVLAHFGRCFNVEFFKCALKELGRDIDRLYFDTAAVLNPAVYELAFDKLDYKRILFGTDFPIMLWHGQREWENGTYINLCREDFSWSNHKYPERENGYTFFVYEQVKNILDTIGDNTEAVQAVFNGNAQHAYKALNR